MMQVYLDSDLGALPCGSDMHVLEFNIASKRLQQGLPSEAKL
jgi:hypothetical protein